MASNQQDDLDRLLDTALAGYSCEEPRPGLEQRVLAHIQAVDTPRRFGWRWAVLIPAFASVLLIATVYRRGPHQAIPGGKIVAVQAPAVEVRPAARPVASPPITARRTVTFPKRSVFPLPSPLSPEERALVDLAARFPDQAREVLADKRGIEPIEIPEIQIPLLPGGSDQ
jgi:hypothetical protein